MYYYILNAAPRKLKEAGFDMARTTTKNMYSISLNLLTNSTGKLKTSGGILVFRVLVQVCLVADSVKIIFRHY